MRDVRCTAVAFAAPSEPDGLKRSFPPVADARTRLLVVGSLPGERSLAERRYYAHPQNGFWRLMSDVIGRDLVPLEYEDRLAALLERGVGLWDVIGSATRTGSSDAAIRDPNANDLVGLVRSLPALRAIGFNGGTALKHGVRQLGRLTDSVEVVALPSSSPLHAVPIATKHAAWNGLRPYLTGDGGLARKRARE